MTEQPKPLEPDDLKQDIYDHGGSRIYSIENGGRSLICDTYQTPHFAKAVFDFVKQYRDGSAEPQAEPVADESPLIDERLHKLHWFAYGCDPMDEQLDPVDAQRACEYFRELEAKVSEQHAKLTKICVEGGYNVCARCGDLIALESEVKP